MKNDQGPNCYHVVIQREATTRAPTGALSDSNSVTTEELLVNRLGDTVIVTE